MQKLPFWPIFVSLATATIISTTITAHVLNTQHALNNTKPIVNSPVVMNYKHFAKPNIPYEQNGLTEIPSLEDTSLSSNDGWSIITNPDSELLLVNKKRKLPEGFTPSQLIIPNVRFSVEGNIEKNHLKAVAALSLEKLFLEAEANGHIIFAISGYRSYDRQKSIYQSNIKSKGLEYTKKISAFPGSSEHQTGYAMDISTNSQNFQLTKEFGTTPEGKWVKLNAHKFGFIIRYPEHKTSITGFSYEPWHLRYVGIPLAEYMYRNNLTLEEVYKFDNEK